MLHRLRLRKPFALALGVWLAALVCAAHAVGAEQKGLLWKIERDGVKPSFLLGTMHSEDPRVVKVAPEVQRAFDASTSFTMEVVLDTQTIADTAQAMVFSDGRDLKTVLGTELYNKIVPLMAQHGVPETILPVYKPWAIFLTLSMPPAKTGVFLDAALYEAALTQKKVVHGLETVKEQLSIFDRMTAEEQSQLVADAVKHFGELKGVFEEMIGIYLKRDLPGLQALNEKYTASDDSKLEQKLMAELIDVRNLRMVERMAPRLKEGKAFVAVGALHLPGDHGLLRLLEKQGYRVSAVY